MLIQDSNSLARRRQFLMSLAASGAFFTTPGLLAGELSTTASLGEGPFYPDALPLDTDNDLLVLNDSVTPAVGTVTHLSGRVLDVKGDPVRSAFVEIWQVDSSGAYLHSKSANASNRDTNFQGYGRFLTDSKGRYYFRTIKPVAYPGRTPHIHIAVSQAGKRVLTTQILEKGNPQNKSDGLYRRLKTDADRQSVLGAYQPIANSPLNELAASFDCVIGRTADENDLLKGVAPSKRQQRQS